jgi:hypothetical protein
MDLFQFFELNKIILIAVKYFQFFRKKATQLGVAFTVKLYFLIRILFFWKLQYHFLK